MSEACTCAARHISGIYQPVTDAGILPVDQYYSFETLQSTFSNAL